MPDFSFTGPDGKTYSITGPPGATPEQAFAMLQQHLGVQPEAPAAAPAAPSPGGAAATAGTTGANYGDTATDVEPERPGFWASIGAGVNLTGQKIAALSDKMDLAVDKAKGRDADDATVQADQAALGGHTAGVKEAGAALESAQGINAAAGNVAAGLTYAPFLAAAPFVAAGAEGNARYQELIDQGVDPDTALKASTVHGIINGVSQMIPMGSVATRAGMGALARTGAVAGSRAAAVGGGQELTDDLQTSAVLRAAGYGDLAKQYDPTTAKIAGGAAFMTGLHVGGQLVHGLLPAGKAAAPAATPGADASATPPDAAPTAPGSTLAALQMLHPDRPVIEPADTPPGSPPTAPTSLDEAGKVAAKGAAAADAQGATAATALDNAKDADGAIAAATALATRPSEDVQAAGAAALFHEAANSKLEEANDAEATINDATAKAQEEAAKALEPTTGETAAMREDEGVAAGTLPEENKLTEANPQAAFHGTPNPKPFDKFSTDAIGSGEGNQSFGWGMYFAGLRKVAEHYQRALTYRDIVNQFRNALPDNADTNEALEAAQSGELPEGMARVIHALAHDDWLGFDYPAQAITAAFKDGLDKYDASPELHQAVNDYKGRLYQVDVPEDHHLLDWDNPLNEQPPAVQKAINNSEYDLPTMSRWGSGMDNPRGQQIYGALVQAHGSPKAASQYLHSQGVRGLRYLDGVSRKQGEGFHNYVIFHPDDVNITEVQHAADTSRARADQGEGAPGSPGHLTTNPDPAFRFARNLKEAVAHVAKTGNDFARAVVERIMPYLGDASFHVVDDDVPVPGGVPRALQGAYGVQQTWLARKMNGVWVKGDTWGDGQGMNNQTVLHEALHQATARKVVLGEAPVAKGTALGQHVEDLNKLRSYVITVAKMQIRAGRISAEMQNLFAEAFNDAREFITYGFTDARVREFLKSIPGVFNRTAWSDFVDKVRGILGLPVGHTSALADLIDISDRIMSSKKTPEIAAYEKGLVDQGKAQRFKPGDNEPHDDETTLRTPEERAAPDTAAGGHDAEVPGGEPGTRALVPVGAEGGAPDAASPGREVVVHPDALSGDSGTADAASGANGGAAGTGLAHPAGAQQNPALGGGGAGGGGGRGPGGPRGWPGGTGAWAHQPGTPQAAIGHATTFGQRARAAVGQFVEGIGLGKLIADLQYKVAPMAMRTANDFTRSVAKNAANSMRLVQKQWEHTFDLFTDKYTDQQLRGMYEAGEEENLIQGGQMQRTPTNGLGRLTPDEQHVLLQLNAYAKQVMQEFKALGGFVGDEVPFWVARMAAIVNPDGSISPARGGSVAQNLSKNAPSFRGRKYTYASDTEAAQKAKLGQRAFLVRDIRTSILAIAQMERAVVGRRLINQIKTSFALSGINPMQTHAGEGYIRLTDPLYQDYMPDGSRRDIYILKEFQGPLQAITYEHPGALYRAFLGLKSFATHLIMLSPFQHLWVVFGKSLPAVGMNPYILVKTTIRGYQLRNGPDKTVMYRAIKNGMVPMGEFGWHQDVASIAAPRSAQAGKGPVSKIVGGAVGLIDQRAGLLTKKGIDAASNFWQNTLLWHRVADMQLGLYARMEAKAYKSILADGFTHDEAMRGAGILAANAANRYTGALPNEAMSGIARKLANLGMFSRSFTLTNVGAFKDAVLGLPRDMRAQLTQEFSKALADKVNGKMRLKALATLALDMGGVYVLGSFLQDTLRAYTQSNGTLDDYEKQFGKRMAAYVPRWQKALAHVMDDPKDMIPYAGHPFKVIHSFGSTGNNEPGLENRVRGPDLGDGTATYMRLPVGKVGEDFEGLLSDPAMTAFEKSSTLVKPLVDIAGQKFYGHTPGGQVLWDSKTDSTLTIMGKAVAHFAAAQTPYDTFKTVHDAIADASTKPEDRTKLAVAKALAPMTPLGLSVRQGAPGGPAAAQVAQEKRDAEAHQEAVLQDVHQLLQTKNPDDRDAAMAKLRTLGWTPGQMIGYLRNQAAPTGRVNARTLTDLAREDPAALQRVRDKMAEQ